jgi:hypothetical protein
MELLYLISVRSMNSLVFVMEAVGVYCTVGTQFLVAFAKLRKAIISFLMSVCLSVRMEKLGSH